MKEINNRRTLRRLHNKPNHKPNQKIIIGLVHADEWCGHCKELRPKWDMMIKQLSTDKKYKNKYVIKSFDESNDKNKADNNQKMTSLHKDLPANATGYPTIFRIKMGRLDIYNGEREVGPMIIWFFDEHDNNEHNNNDHVNNDHNKYNLLGLFKGGYQTSHQQNNTQNTRKSLSSHKKIHSNKKQKKLRFSIM